MIPDQYIHDAVKIRQDLHRIPELKYEEVKTSSFIVKALKSYGYNPKEKIGKTGIVALLDTGKPGKTIAFRADIDALPILESTKLPYQSKHQGVMHACGHDGHTATLLLVARVLQEIKSKLKGKIKLIFQPAEEGGKGSIAMIQDGVLKDPEVDAIFGYHNWPGLPLHTVATRKGCILAGSGRFEITIVGKRAHLAKPKEAINPVSIGAGIVKKIEALSLKNSIVNLLGFNSGDWKEGTSLETKIVGCYFVEGEEAFLKLKQNIESIAQGFGIATFYEFQSATINTSHETDLVFLAAKKNKIQDIREFEQCQMAGEDFSEYLKLVPGCYFLIGVGENAPSLHTASYDFSDAILRTAAELMLQIAVDGGNSIFKT